MHIEEKPNRKETSLRSKSEVKLACDLLRGRFFGFTTLRVEPKKRPKKKTPSLIRVAVNKNFNLHMYLRIALLLQNKLLI